MRMVFYNVRQNSDRDRTWRVHTMATGFAFAVCINGGSVQGQSFQTLTYNATESTLPVMSRYYVHVVLNLNNEPHWHHRCLPKASPSVRGLYIYSTSAIRKRISSSFNEVAVRHPYLLQVRLSCHCDQIVHSQHGVRLDDLSAGTLVTGMMDRKNHGLAYRPPTNILSYPPPI
jgi:hypothetical protein